MVNWGMDPSFRGIFHVVLDTSQQLLVSHRRWKASRTGCTVEYSEDPLVMTNSWRTWKWPSRNRGFTMIYPLAWWFSSSLCGCLPEGSTHIDPGLESCGFFNGAWLRGLVATRLPGFTQGDHHSLLSSPRMDRNEPLMNNHSDIIRIFMFNSAISMINK